MRRLLVVVAVVLLVSGPAVWWRVHNARVPLLSVTAGILPDGERVALPPGDGRTFFAGTRVIHDADPRAAMLAAAQRERVRTASAGLPASNVPDLVEAALLDLDTLRLDNGAVVASWPQSWRYVWPRDASFVAVALARAGRRQDAAEILAFLQRIQPDSGVFDARYLPDGSGAVPDDRGEQSDGAGWVLWAVREVWHQATTEAERPGPAAGSASGEGAALLQRFRPLVQRSTHALMVATDSAPHLPAPSLDYWELPTDTLTLGTAAPIALGLRSAADLLAGAGDPAAPAVRDRAAALDAAIRAGFGPGYPRYLGQKGSDAAVAFRLPPFTDCVDPAVRAAWQAAARGMRRPAGGLAPGTTWPNNGVSWTPQTALFALTAASIGDRDRATHWLSWLDSHRTATGSLPEKVLSNGAPAGPAPLSWTAALVLLTVQAMAGPPAPACPS